MEPLGSLQVSRPCPAAGRAVKGRRSQRCRHRSCWHSVALLNATELWSHPKGLSLLGGRGGRWGQQWGALGRLLTWSREPWTRALVLDSSCHRTSRVTSPPLVGDLLFQSCVTFSSFLDLPVLERLHG